MEFKKGITMEDAFVIMKRILHEDVVKIKITGMEIRISDDDDDCNQLLVEIEADEVSWSCCVYPSDIYATGYDLNIGGLKIKYVEKVRE